MSHYDSSLGSSQKELSSSQEDESEISQTEQVTSTMRSNLVSDDSSLSQTELLTSCSHQYDAVWNEERVTNCGTDMAGVSAVLTDPASEPTPTQISS